jgi:hypothetical protein
MYAYTVYLTMVEEKMKSLGRSIEEEIQGESI